MKQYLTKHTKKFDQDTFLMVVRTTGYFQAGTVYTFVEFPDKQFIRQALCVHVRTMKRKDLTEEISFLDSDCDLEVYSEILANRGLAIDSSLTIATFTAPNHSKKHYSQKITENVGKLPK